MASCWVYQQSFRTGCWAWACSSLAAYSLKASRSESSARSYAAVGRKTGLIAVVVADAAVVAAAAVASSLDD